MYSVQNGDENTSCGGTGLDQARVRGRGDTCPVHGVAQGGGDTWVWDTALSSEAPGGG